MAEFDQPVVVVVTQRHRGIIEETLTYHIPRDKRNECPNQKDVNSAESEFDALVWLQQNAREIGYETTIDDIDETISVSNHFWY